MPWVSFYVFWEMPVFSNIQITIQILTTTFVSFLVVVHFVGFGVIARYPTVRLSRKLVEIYPTGLPDLPKPLRTSILLRKP